MHEIDLLDLVIPIRPLKRHGLDLVATERDDDFNRFGNCFAHNFGITRFNNVRVFIPLSRAYGPISENSG